MKKFFVLVLANFISFFSYSQYYVYPLDTPLLLSATYAELRANHFHSGIDIKTNEKIGKPVKSIADGYIYRIKVSPYGFGKALYVRHYDGKSSVYAHLCCFSPLLDSIVLAEMYKKKKNSIEYFPKGTKIRVKKGEVIGYSGNSGSSQGPHLHFEIRDSKSEHPLNPLKFNFRIEDTIKPRMYDLILYDLRYKSYQNGKYCKHFKKLKSKNIDSKTKEYFLSEDTVYVPEKLGLVLNVVDFVNNSKNVCGVYGIDLKMDGRKIYELKFDEFSFYETRYINSLIDYPMYKLRKKKMYRLFKQPGNELSFLKNKGDGIIELNDDKVHLVEIITYDFYNNLSILKFYIKKNDAVECKDKKDGKILLSRKKVMNKIKGKSFEFDISGKSLYDDVYISFEEDTAEKKYFSAVVKFGINNTVPLHRRNILIIKPNKPIPKKLQPKLTIAKIKKQKVYDLGGVFTKDGYVVAKVREFADYVVTVDTISPTIKPLNVYANKNLKSEDKISFKVYDDLTGIGFYNCYIDGKWTRVDYDPKNKRMHCMFKEVITKAKKQNHKLIFTVVDKKGNSSVYSLSFVY